jgi:hypothetical protein
VAAAVVLAQIINFLEVLEDLVGVDLLGDLEQLERLQVRQCKDMLVELVVMVLYQE